jgi:hypothetical protein
MDKRIMDTRIVRLGGYLVARQSWLAQFDTDDIPFPAGYSLKELRALAIVAMTCREQGSCDYYVYSIAMRARISESVARRALRRAVSNGEIQLFRKASRPARRKMRN